MPNVVRDKKVFFESERVTNRPNPSQFVNAPKLQPRIVSEVNDDNDPNEDEIVPVKRFEFKVNASKRLKFPIESGITPIKQL